MPWPALLLLARLVPAADAGDLAARAPVIRRLATRLPAGRLRVAATATGSRFNDAGHVILGWYDTARREDALLECAADGATVWSCRLSPGGRMTAFTRLTDGTTAVALAETGRDPVVLLLSPTGRQAGGWTLAAARIRDRQPVSALSPLGDGAFLAATAGWAGAVSPAGRVTKALRLPRLRAAWPVRDGRWLATLADPPGFAAWDGATVVPIPLDALCHVWEAARAEEIAPGRFRFTGCFCQTLEPATAGRPIIRRTLEVVETDPAWTLQWTYASPKALRVDEFGAERCATFTRQAVTLDGGRRLLLDGSPGACAAVELGPDGTRGRVWLAAEAGAPRGMFGETACPLLGAQVLESR